MRKFLLYSTDPKVEAFLRAKALPFIEFYYDDNCSLEVCRTQSDVTTILSSEHSIDYFCIDIKKENDCSFFMNTRKKHDQIPLLVNASRAISPTKYIAGGVSPDSLIMLDDEKNSDDRKFNEKLLKEFLRTVKKSEQYEALQCKGIGRDSGALFFPSLHEIIYISKDYLYQNVYVQKDINDLAIAYKNNKAKSNDQKIKVYSQKKSLQTLHEILGHTFFKCKRNILINKTKITGVNMNELTIELCDGLVNIPATKEQCIYVADIFS